MSEASSSHKQMMFLSHNIAHPRCQYIISSLKQNYDLFLPDKAHWFKSILSLGVKSVDSLLRLGVGSFVSRMPKHVDGIDVFVSPLWKHGTYLLDYHVPLVPELKWLKMSYLAHLTSVLLPGVISSAKVVIAANWRMLRHAAKYGRIKHGFVVPDYPFKSFKVNTTLTAARDRVGISDDSRIALFVGGGRLHSIYGIDLLFRTWMRVRKKLPNVELYVIGNTSELLYDIDIYKKLESVGVRFVGRVPHLEIPYWIAASDICLSQRTPGFPSEFYDVHDSMKISEYAAFEKPIVAAGYSECRDFLSASTNVESYSNAIVSAFKGNAPRPTPHFWEENEPIIKEAYSSLYD